MSRDPAADEPRATDALRVVVDTNVIISALLHPERTCGRALDALLGAGAVLLLDARIEAEYRAVVVRPKFRAVAPAAREARMTSLLGAGEHVHAVARYEGALIDDDDRVFLEVARAGRADYLVTGNTRHYPAGCGVAVVTAAELCAACAARGGPGGAHWAATIART